MMDPAAVIGLAANTVQFVDFSCKVLQDTKSLYRSSRGASAKNNVVEVICSDLMDLNNALTAHSVLGAIPESMRNLASNCKDVAAELLETLNKIKVHEIHRKWKSFVPVLRTVWEKEHIEELVKRRKRLRNETQYRLQLMLSEGQSEFRMMLAGLVAENRTLKLDGAQQLGGLLQGVHDAIYQLQAKIKGRNEAAQNNPQAVRELRSGDATETIPPWEDMKELANNVLSLANEVKLSPSDHMLLSSLRFDYINGRQAIVEPAYEQKFRWVLDPSSPAKFENWVRSHKGIYWVMGNIDEVSTQSYQDSRIIEIIGES